MTDFIKFIFTLFVIYQITSIITESTFPLFKLLRVLHEFESKSLFINWILAGISQFFSCFLCTSVWVGFIISNYLYNISFELGYENQSWFWSGLFYSSLTWFIHIIENKIS